MLAPEDRRTLEQMLRQAALSQAMATRVRVVLAVADGDSYSTIAETLRARIGSLRSGSAGSWRAAG